MSTGKSRERQHEELIGTIEKHKIFVFKDQKSTSYGPPITVQTRGMFIRDVQDALKQGQMVWAKHPQDFAIFEIGEYDPFKGAVELYENKNCLGLVQDFQTSLGEKQ